MKYLLNAKRYLMQRLLLSMRLNIDGPLPVQKETIEAIKGYVEGHEALTSILLFQKI